MTPMHPAQRPAWRVGHPAMWMLQGQVQHLRREARAFLRELLAGYLRTAPEQVPLRFSPGEAPSVAASWQGTRLSISMSYSTDVALIALCPGARIGIDVTTVAPMPDWAQVARLYLGPESLSHLTAIDDVGRDQMFALAWAEMEARSKCLGLGLQEWSAARQQRLQERTMQLSTCEVAGAGSGQRCVVAVAWEATP